ncbi:MAG: hypothetical protein LBV72_11550 [Tannerella sp.]|nr:hypothetical protein [Tannerella sp.]
MSKIKSECKSLTFGSLAQWRPSSPCYYVKRIFVILVGLLSALTGCRGAKTPPPEDFFSSTQLILAQAIKRGDLDEVREVISTTDLNCPGKQDMTLLFFALQCASGEKPVQLQIITLLIEAGADPLHEIPGLGTALGVALRAKSPLYVQAFLDGGVDPNTVKGMTPIIFDAAREYTFSTLKLLVTRGADINKRNSLGNTVLNQALSSYQLDQVDWLLDQGANPDVVDINGNSFASQLQFQINRQQEDTRTWHKLIEIRDRIVLMGIKWPPDSREIEKERMLARGQTPGKLLELQGPPDGKQPLLTEQDMEHLRQLAIASLEADAGHREFAEGLRQANLWHIDDIFRFGSWIFGTRDNMVALIHHPPRSPHMRLVVVTFICNNSVWAVNSISDETVRSLQE